MVFEYRPKLLGTAYSLCVDLVTAEVVQAFRRREVPCVLLKGPVTVEWLYADGTYRPYGDSDLLVPSTLVPVAEAVLRELGFRYAFDAFGPEPSLPAGLAWRRGEDKVDLHETLIGIEAEPAAVWTALTASTETRQIGGEGVRVLTRTPQAFHVALHAAQHGVRDHQALEDLGRAIARLHDSDWRAAGELAEALEAVEAFARGLRMLPAGAEIAARLGLPEGTSIRTELNAASRPPGAVSFDELTRAKGARQLSAQVARKLFPSRAFMRWWTPLARRGPGGLVAAYAWRLAWIAGHSAPGFRAWLRARRQGLPRNT